MKILVSQTWAFEKEIARLNKRAAKVGFAPITYTNLGRKTVEQTRVVIETLEGESRERECRIPVDVTAYELVLPDAEQYRWTLLGKIERLEDGTTFVDVKDLDLAAKWTTADPCNCDHCHTSRNRNFTYIIQNKDDARQMQVGRNCFADYIGHDGLLKLEFLSLVVSMFDLGEDECWPGEAGSGRRSAHVVSARRVIAAAEWMNSQSGWQYNQKDEWGQLIADGTHRKAASVATAPMPTDAQGKPLTNGIWGMFQNPSHPMWAAADAIIERLKSYEAPADDEFAQALVYAVNFEVLPERKASLIAYAGQFLRNVASRKALDARKPFLKHIGAVGAREVFELTCKSVITREGDFGTTYITRFEDKDGNQVTWFASKSVANEGDTLKLKATVKKHDQFNGVPQTIITRGKAV